MVLLTKNGFSISPVRVILIIRDLLAGHKIFQADIARIVQYHNFKRSKVAKGEEDLGNPGPQEQASNMIKIHWDDLLARAAQRSVTL